MGNYNGKYWIARPDPGFEEEWERLKAESPVRIQWDPERDLLLQPLPHRAIQIGLSKKAVDLYVNQWIRRITDVTPLAHEAHNLIARNRLNEALAILPAEQPYQLNSEIEISTA